VILPYKANHWGALYLKKKVVNDPRSVKALLALEEHPSTCASNHIGAKRAVVSLAAYLECGKGVAPTKSIGAHVCVWLSRRDRAGPTRVTLQGCS